MHMYIVSYSGYIFFLHQACPFLFENFTQECDGEVEILPMALSSKHVDPSLCQLTRGRGLTGTVRGGGKDVVAHLLVTSHDNYCHRKQVTCNEVAFVWAKTECNYAMYLQGQLQLMLYTVDVFLLHCLN